MATETEMTPAREPGQGQAPVLVTRLAGQQRMFAVGRRSVWAVTRRSS